MIRTLIVDDEQPARERLRQMLSGMDGLEVIGEAQDGEAAVQRIVDLCPDLVFLDIQMPGLTGLEVVKALKPPRPQIIFCTAYDQYALSAFEQQALDYLLKPVKRERLAQAVSRMRESLEASTTLPREVGLAGRVQAGMLPQSAPALAGLEFAAISTAARTVGGDYYDCFSIAEGLLAVSIADVSGKGISAGLLMANLQGRLQSRAPLHLAQARNLVADLNQALCGTMDEARFISLFYGTYDETSRVLTFVNAGHPPPFLFSRAPGNPREPVTHAGCTWVQRLTAGGPVLGLLPNASFQQESVKLSAGDVLLLFSDGVSEAMNAAEEEFGETRLQELLIRNADESAQELVERILTAIHDFTGQTPWHDDLTLMVLRPKEDVQTSRPAI
jgi:sigma-B regulation protein RsbU (phosphoserine phosphatase)